MGSSNREYMRDDDEGGQSQGPAWAHDIPTTKWLIIISVVTFFLQTLLIHAPDIDQDAGGAARAMRGLQPSYVEEWFSLETNKVLHGQIWRLVTYVFCSLRVDPWPLVFNMLTLWFFGATLERMYGSREILWFYLAAAIVCGVIFTGFGVYAGLPLVMMGATSSTMALFCLFATHFPRQQILFFWFIPVEIRVLMGVYIAIDVYHVLQAYSGTAPWIILAYLSNLWGIAFGYVYRRANWRFAGFADALDIRRWQKSMRRASTARNLRVYQPESTANLDEQVDAILAKIHEQGSDSLTERERAILQRASDQAKNRL